MISWTKQKHSLVPRTVPHRDALASGPTKLQHLTRYSVPAWVDREGRRQLEVRARNRRGPAEGPHRSREPIWWRCLTQASQLPCKWPGSPPARLTANYLGSRIAATSHVKAAQQAQEKRGLPDLGGMPSAVQQGSGRRAPGYSTPALCVQLAPFQQVSGPAVLCSVCLAFPGQPA